MNALNPKNPPQNKPEQPGKEGGDGGSGAPAAPKKELTPEEQMALYEEDLKETDWGHQPC
jgi:hypothetical protein